MRRTVVVTGLLLMVASLALAHDLFLKLDTSEDGLPGTSLARLALEAR